MRFIRREDEYTEITTRWGNLIVWRRSRQEQGWTGGNRVAAWIPKGNAAGPLKVNVGRAQGYAYEPVPDSELSFPPPEPKRPMDPGYREREGP